MKSEKVVGQQYDTSWNTHGQCSSCYRFTLFIVLVLSIVLLYKRTQNYCTFFAFISFHIFYAIYFRVFVLLNSSRCKPKSYSLDFVKCHESCEVGFRFILLLNPT